MKTRFISLWVIVAVLAISASFTLSAQSLVVTHFDQSPIMGTAVSTLDHHGTLKNVSATPKTVIVRYFQTGTIAYGHYASMCTDEICISLPNELFGAPHDLPEVVLQPNGTVALKAQISPQGNEGISTLNFLIFDKDNPADSLSYVVAFNVNNANSVQDLSVATGATVSPNPSSEGFRISGSVAPTVASVDLYDVNGAVVYSATHNGGSTVFVDVRSLAIGAYSAIVRTTNGTVYRTPVSVVR